MFFKGRTGGLRRDAGTNTDALFELGTPWGALGESIGWLGLIRLLVAVQ